MGTMLPRRFEPIRVLRKSSASATFVATDQQLGRNEVVVKVIAKGNFTSDTSSLVEFFSWYEGLRHPLLSTVLDAGLTPKRDLFYVRDYHPDSEFLSSPSKESVKALISAVDFFQVVGRAHGAIKPSNIFASDGALRISDPWIGQSGKSKQLSEQEIRFTAPEVLSGGMPTLESDLYSLGALLYRYYSGRHPFEDSDPEFLKAKYIWASPRPLASVCHVSKTIADIVSHLLDKDPTQRQAAFESLKTELEVEGTPAARAPAIGFSSSVQNLMHHFTTYKGLSAVVLEGPAGSGKSRLVEELKGRVAFAERPVAVCEAGTPEPYLSLGRKLVSLAEEHGIAAGTSSLSRLQRFIDTGREPTSKSTQGEINDSLISLIAAICRQVRLLLVIDDIDRASRRLAGCLETLARRSEDAELWVAVAARPGNAFSRTLGSLRECLKGRLYEMPLEGLAASDARLLTSFLSVERDQRIRAEQNAGGNPGFLEEFCRRSTETVAPRRVRQILSSMILSLSREHRRVAEILSLFDEPTTLEVISNVSGLIEAELRAAVSQLERVGLVDRETLAIRYPDARTSLHSKIPKARRTDLHARAFRCLQASGSNNNVLAKHAFEGGLFSTACELYRQLANKSFDEKDFTNAGRYFGLVSDCWTRDSNSRPLDPTESIRLAKCYGYKGSKLRAQVILKKLLESNSVSGDPNLVSLIYCTLASPLVADSPKERARLFGLAIESSRQDSPTMAYQHASLITALLSSGDLAEAESALRRAESASLSKDRLIELEAVRGTVLMNQGDFRSAATCFSGKSAGWVNPGSILNNRAVCIEQLGDIAKAREVQKAALHQSEASGSLIIQIVSLTNLGAMETKLGNIEAAEKFFAKARFHLRTLRQQSGELTVNLPSSFADMAALSIQKGDYQIAIEYLRNVDVEAPGPFFPLERFLVFMTHCELHLALGQSQHTQAMLNVAKGLRLTGDFFAVDRLLVEERLEVPSSEICRRLEEALTVCEHLETVHQGCRVRLALARHRLALGDRSQGRLIAEAARRISTANGYRPIAAAALLLMGLSAEAREDTETALKGAMEEATEMGFAPLLADAAFRLGTLRFSRGDYFGAQHYLSKNLSITARLAEGLSGAVKRSYLSRASHVEAKNLFAEALRKPVAYRSIKPDLFNQEDDSFAKVYRLTAAMTAAVDLGSAIEILLQALREAINHSIVVVSEVRRQAVYYPVRITLSDETRKRISSIVSAAGNKPYIAGTGPGRRQCTAMWAPILSSALTGGIYVENEPGELFLDERDIEFLTIVGALAGAALDHVFGKAVGAEHISIPNLYGIVGDSNKMREVRTRIEIAATNAATVLIEGESGTGKELVARAIHQQSGRAKGPFIPVDCGALPEGLIEAELFGARKGAYTGAVSDRLGLFEAANHGTIFLDEISNLGLAAQAKLLRVLQEREVRKIGSMSGKTVDVRLFAATNCSLERLVRDGKFRQDLLYRLKVLHVPLPPLRDRKDDIPLLATSFLERLNTANQSKKYFGPRVMDIFLRHNYPGNVRELQNAVERAFYTTTGPVITDVEFFTEVGSVDSPAHDETASWFKDLAEGRENFWSGVHDRYKRRDISRERVVALIDFGLRTAGGNYKTMASMLQIPKSEYRRFMDFLRRSQCLLDFRPYRKANEMSD
jgi:DNA-binding NtrC family response regulator/tetratricopeptide (TPR) repeat protein